MICVPSEVQALSLYLNLSSQSSCLSLNGIKSDTHLSNIRFNSNLTELRKSIHDTFVGYYNLHNVLPHTVSQLFPKAAQEVEYTIPFLRPTPRGNYWIYFWLLSAHS